MGKKRKKYKGNGPASLVDLEQLLDEVLSHDDTVAIAFTYGGKRYQGVAHCVEAVDEAVPGAPAALLEERKEGEDA